MFGHCAICGLQPQRPWHHLTGTCLSLAATDVDGDGRVDVLSAGMNDNKVVLHTNTMCPRGSSGPDGYAPCSPCVPGRYSNDSLQASCTLCLAGRFGTVMGAINATSGCAGTCTPGFMCPAGSTNATSVVCPAGMYSLGSAGTCTDCAPGLYGAATGMDTSTCTAPCRPGSYGGGSGLTSPTCSGNCTAGYACPAGSTSPLAQLCPSGRFSTAGSGVCTECPVGVYGDSVGLTTPACSGPCAVGYVCPSGSNSSTPVPSCAAGRYGDVVTSTCVDCPAGRFGPTSGSISVSVCTACAAGFFGNTTGLTVARCSGACPAGYYCSGEPCYGPVPLLRSCVVRACVCSIV
jgi:hypothetical protein